MPTLKTISLQQEKDILLLLSFEEDYLGNGASRAVFDCNQDILDILGDTESNPNDYVVKVALGKGGLTQTENEVSFYKQHQDSGYLAEILAYGRYITIMEKVDCYEVYDLAEAIYDDADVGDEYLYEEYGEYYDLTEDQFYQLSNCIAFMHNYAGHTSDNGQVGLNKAGDFVAYDYGYMTSECTDSQVSDISDYLNMTTLKMYMKNLAKIVNLELKVFDEFELNFIKYLCSETEDEYNLQLS